MWCVERHQCEFQTTLLPINADELLFTSEFYFSSKVSIFSKRPETCFNLFSLFSSLFLDYVSFKLCFEIRREEKNSFICLLGTHVVLSMQFIHSMIMSEKITC